MHSSPSIFIGTAGYNYAHWRNDVFYPTGLPHSQELSYFSSRVAAVEINTTFHGLPREKTFENWDRRSNSKGNRLRFVFKVLQDITHKTRFSDLELVRRFIMRIVEHMSSDKVLGFLFQLPASFSKDIEKLEKVGYLLRVELNLEVGVVFEFRNEGWFDDEVYHLMKRYQLGIVEQYCPKGVNFPKPPLHWLEDPPGLSYIRMHGSKGTHEHDWRDTLPTLANCLHHRSKLSPKPQLVFFLNDWEGKAPGNADDLYTQLKQIFGHTQFTSGFKMVQNRQASIASLFSIPSTTGKLQAEKYSKVSKMRNPLVAKGTYTEESPVSGLGTGLITAKDKDPPYFLLYRDSTDASIANNSARSIIGKGLDDGPSQNLETMRREINLTGSKIQSQTSTLNKSSPNQEIQKHPSQHKILKKRKEIMKKGVLFDFGFTSKKKKTEMKC